MAEVVFVGDEAAVAGFRLAGVEGVVPAPGGEAQALAGARARARLVLITAACAARVPAPELERARTAVSPLLLVLGDLDGRTAPPDLARAVRRQLGMQT
jgi:vacuolar-type H+-ATPase subunit F/Vma7